MGRGGWREGGQEREFTRVKRRMSGFSARGQHRRGLVYRFTILVDCFVIAQHNLTSVFHAVYRPTE